ncbi:hypothetical protein [Georgenia daeguensis]|uniref:Uncharacterized protein n=1 Tax=Georgenia daeguensis TaxID=908355 RepID=A0ABP8ESB7_9MICO
MSVVPIPPRTRWVPDPRGGGRGVRISAHPEAGVVVLSVWRADECVATVRLRPAEAAELMSALAASLAEVAESGAARPGPGAGRRESGPAARPRAS